MPSSSSSSMASSDHEEGPKRHAPATRTPHRVGPPHAARQRLEWAAWTALNLGATLVTALLLRTLPGEDRTLFLLYYQPLIPALAMLWFWTVAVWHWERRGVRYAACFSPEDARHLPGSAVLFRAGTALSAVTTLSGAVFLYQLAEGQRGAAALQPPLMYGSLAVALLWPGPGFHGDTRRFLARTLTRVALPVHAVSWADFFLADVATSLSKSVGDGARALCAVAAGPGAAFGSGTCGESGALAPLGSALPYAVRLVQCVRVFRDTGARSQAFNAVKYATAFPAIALAGAAASVGPELWLTTLRPLWVGAAALNAAYSYFWDLERDWEIGFFSQMDVQKTALPRPELASPAMYPRAVYLYLMTSNLVLRLTWIYKLSDGLRANALVVSFFALLEVFRRFQWMFVRVEVELRKLQNQKPELGSLMGHDGSAALSSPKPGAATPTHPFHTHEPKL
ncbi:EXS1 [Auxenochlorella protothecoides x Auxenochlorella symbiontica]